MWLGFILHSGRKDIRLVQDAIHADSVFVVLTFAIIGIKAALHVIFRQVADPVFGVSGTRKTYYS